MNTFHRNHVQSAYPRSFHQLTTNGQESYIEQRPNSSMTTYQSDINLLYLPAWRMHQSNTNRLNLPTWETRQSDTNRLKPLTRGPQKSDPTELKLAAWRIVKSSDSLKPQSSQELLAEVNILPLKTFIRMKLKVFCDVWNMTKNLLFKSIAWLITEDLCKQSVYGKPPLIVNRYMLCNNMKTVLYKKMLAVMYVFFRCWMHLNRRVLLKLNRMIRVTSIVRVFWNISRKVIVVNINQILG